MSRSCTPEDVLPSFVKDIAEHQMEVIRDEGAHRHLRFKRPGTSVYWFDIITWPGVLTIDGDMGTFVFKRLHDMFEFFRTDIGYGNSTGRQHFINPGYWSEKLAAVCRHGYEKFEPEVFRERVKEEFDQWVESEKPYDGADDEYCPQAAREAFDAAKAELWERLEYEVLSCADDGDVRAYDAAREFQWEEGGWHFSMEDCWEWNCNQYSFHFIWCCYAIVWAIRRYDESKTPVQPVATEAA